LEDPPVKAGLRRQHRILKRMHADGNIQFANYQNLGQMNFYLTQNGFADTVAFIA
tara:strand:+ start:268 stop:432 length:165 start_codon:yes stop_codon:yes gene_type:complete